MNHLTKAHLLQRGISQDIILKIEQLNDMQSRAHYQSLPAFSDFIDPETLYIAIEVLASSPKLFAFGGYENAEYQQICFSETEILVSDYPITLLNIKYQPKFGKLAHKDVLGALMSLGLVREKFGDIFIHENYVQVFVCNDMADYVIKNLTKIKRQGVKVSESDLNKCSAPLKNLESIAFTVASLRLDVVIAAAYKISRSKAVNLISSGDVKCNYSAENSVNKTLKKGDLISVRRMGRFYLDDINGVSKKGKLKLSGRRTK